MHSIVLLFLGLVLLLCGISAQETIHCSTLRVEGPAYIQQQQRDQDNQRLFTLAHLPWHVLPNADAMRISLPGEPEGRKASLEEILLSAPSALADKIEMMLSQQEQLLSFDLVKLELGARTNTGSVRCDADTGDLLSLHWYESTFSKSFSDYPLVCDYIYPQEFGVATGSGSIWGDQPRAVRDGTVFQPRGGHEAMAMAVSRINHYKQRWIPLSLSTHSGSNYPLRAITVRSCVKLQNATLLKELVEQKLLAENMTDILSFSSLQSARVSSASTRASSVNEMSISTPLLWPITECVQEESNGACVAHFGYV